MFPSHPSYSIVQYKIPGNLTWLIVDHYFFNELAIASCLLNRSRCPIRYIKIHTTLFCIFSSCRQVDVMFQYSMELSVSPEGDVKFVFPSFVPTEFQSRYMGRHYDSTSFLYFFDKDSSDIVLIALEACAWQATN